MDDGVDDEVMAIPEAEGIHLQRKESEYTLIPESCNLLDEREVLIPSDTGYSSSSHEVFADILDGKNLSRNADALDKFEPRYMGEGGSMVEELTLKNYNSANLAIVGTSNNRERVLTRQSQWLRPYCPGGGGSGSGNLPREVRWGGHGLEILGESAGNVRFPDMLTQNLFSSDTNVITKKSENIENRTVSCDRLPSGGIRTKVLSKSGFSEFFVKNSLRGKGVVSRGLVHDGCSIEAGQQNDTNVVGNSKDSSFCMPSSNATNALPSFQGVTEFYHAPNSLNDGTCLRSWLNAGHHKVNKIESLYMFRKILTLVNFSHSQGVALQDLRPSCFYLLPSNQVKYIGRYLQREILNNTLGEDTIQKKDNIRGKRPEEHGLFPYVSLQTNRKRFADRTNVISCQSPFLPRPGTKLQTDIFHNDINAESGQIFGDEGCREQNSNKKCKLLKRSSSPPMSGTDQKQLVSVNDWLEEKWYTSPEELSKRSCTLSSNIYHLGVLLFELLSSFDSVQVHVAAMSDLNQRILPPQFLSEFPREVGFCLWLLHPEPSSRPTTREILQSVVIHELQNACGDKLSTSIEQDDMDSELLMHFLLELKEIKQKRASKLEEDIRYLEGDIGEVERRCLSNTPLVSHRARGSKFLQKGPSSPEAPHVFSSPSNTNDVRLMKKWNHLENAYFSMRSKIKPHIADDIMSDGGNREKVEDPLGAFFDGLCKYARYSNFEVRSTLRNGDFINSANVICSLCFDRDEDYFAAAGISKKIKIYDFHALLSDSVDIHYPALEMVNRSRLSCICWNNYIKNYLASTDYDGIVKLWDVGTGQCFSQYIEHQKRTWSVDFSRVDPTRLVSGSDDNSVKLWSINEKNCLGTIKSKANVCCVQFSAHFPHLIAFGSSNFYTYCYDLRNVRTPWCTLVGHDKAVSYVKFMDSKTLVSASTDNTLKLWDLNKISTSDLSTETCTVTMSGHTNEKNFVGLSVCDGYIACGSETNEVYAYHRSMPMPFASHKFGSIDPISGKETDDDFGQFVSSVCWGRKSGMVVAANSSGCIKVLQMV